MISWVAGAVNVDEVSCNKPKWFGARVAWRVNIRFCKDCIYL